MSLPIIKASNEAAGSSHHGLHQLGDHRSCGLTDADQAVLSQTVGNVTNPIIEELFVFAK
jgi:hypothetical protein